MISAFGIDHGVISKADDEPSMQATLAQSHGFRRAGVAFKDKAAKKQYVADRKIAGRTIRSGPYSGRNRKHLAAWTAGGGLVGAGVGALKGGGSKTKAAMVAGGVLSGAIEGASTSPATIQPLAQARAIDRGLARGTIATGVPKKQVSWRGYLKPESQ